MIFNSFTYLLFLGVIVGLYWILPRRPRLWLLFGGSLLFYGFWRIEFIPLLLISTATDYWVARAIAASNEPRRRRHLLWLSLAINLGLLAFFKYAIFAVDTVNGLSLWLGMAHAAPFSIPLKIVLPLGISFYTFQSISYTIDVYRRFVRPERDFILFATYVIFFPQLVAGPILRAGEVIWQLDRRPRFSAGNVADGLRRIIAGLFLKCVLADNIAPFVDQGFAAPVGEIGALDVWTLAFLFGFQIYFDFAGYSHIAIGSARLMGIRFPENFDFPYLAATPQAFWRRWHISLSSWIRDYLYLPLCGAKLRDESEGGLTLARAQSGHPVRRTRALWITWALMGLWHGANWTFVLWGLWHAALVALHRAARQLFPWTPPGWASWAVTLPLIMLGWIPFRAESVTEALAMWVLVADPSAYFSLDSGFAGGLIPPIRLTLHRDTYYLAALMLALVAAAWAFRHRVMPRLERSPVALAAGEIAVMTAAVPLVYVFLRPVQQFIYFQF